MSFSWCSICTWINCTIYLFLVPHMIFQASLFLAFTIIRNYRWYVSNFFSARQKCAIEVKQSLDSQMKLSFLWHVRFVRSDSVINYIIDCNSSRFTLFKLHTSNLFANCIIYHWKKSMESETLPIASSLLFIFHKSIFTRNSSNVKF